MGYAAPNLSRFLNRVHRRLFVVRLVEHVGVGLVIGAGVSVVLLPVFMWRDKPAMPVLVALLAVGAVTGAAWLLIRRPRLIETAGEADRQLGLSDLLATAWMVVRRESSADDPFERAVVTVADARAAGLSASSVVLNRFGARAWTGIGLTTALAVTLALLTANPITLRADAERRGVQRVVGTSPRDSGRASMSAVPGSRSAPIGVDQPNREEDGFNPARRTTSVAGDAGESNDSAEAADPSGSGGGAGTSPSNASERLRPPGSAVAHDKGQGSVAGGGGGRRSVDGGASGGTSSLSTVETGAGRAVPPWGTAGWDRRKIEAGNAVRAGAVPQRYHDVIRSYFEREGERP